MGMFAVLFPSKMYILDRYFEREKWMGKQKITSQFPPPALLDALWAYIKKKKTNREMVNHFFLIKLDPA